MQAYVLREIRNELTRTKVLDEPRPCVWDLATVSCRVQQTRCAEFAALIPHPSGSVSSPPMAGYVATTAVEEPTPAPLSESPGVHEAPKEASSTPHDPSSIYLSLATSKLKSWFALNPAVFLIFAAILLTVFTFFLWLVCCYVHVEDDAHIIKEFYKSQRPDLDPEEWEYGHECVPSRNSTLVKKSRRSRARGSQCHEEEAILHSELPMLEHKVRC